MAGSDARTSLCIHCIQVLDVWWSHCHQPVYIQSQHSRNWRWSQCLIICEQWFNFHVRIWGCPLNSPWWFSCFHQPDPDCTWPPWHCPNWTQISYSHLNSGSLSVVLPSQPSIQHATMGQGVMRHFKCWVAFHFISARFWQYTVIDHLLFGPLQSILRCLWHILRYSSTCQPNNQDCASLCFTVIAQPGG